MNRRGFFKSLATAVAGFTILPPATTYERVWMAVRTPSMGCVFYDLEFVPTQFYGEWRFVEFGKHMFNAESWMKSVKSGEFLIGTTTKEYNLCQP